MATSPSTTRSGGLKANADSLIFIGFVIVGALLIFSLKPVFGASQTGVTVAVVALVVGYAVTVALSSLRLRLDQAGDNTYYLGLVFTLLSMSRALIEVGQATGSGGTIRVAEVVIGDFGVALASTLVGIVLRLVLQQMRVDPGDVEQVARIELATAAQQTRNALNSLTHNFGQFHEELTQKHADYIREIQESYRALATESTQALVVTAQRAVADMREVSDSIGQSLAQFTSATQGLTEALHGSAQRLLDIEAPRVKLSNSFKTLSDRIDALSERCGAAGEVVTSVTTGLQEGVTQVQRAAAVIVRAGDLVQTGARRAVDTDASVANHVEALARHGAALGEIVVRLDQSVQSTEATAAASRAAADVAQHSAMEILDGLTDVIRRVDRNLESSGDATV